MAMRGKCELFEQICSVRNEGSKHRQTVQEVVGWQKLLSEAAVC